MRCAVTVKEQDRTDFWMTDWLIGLPFELLSSLVGLVNDWLTDLLVNVLVD